MSPLKILRPGRRLFRASYESHETSNTAEWPVMYVLLPSDSSTGAQCSRMLVPTRQWEKRSTVSWKVNRQIYILHHQLHGKPKYTAIGTILTELRVCSVQGVFWSLIRIPRSVLSAGCPVANHSPQSQSWVNLKTRFRARRSRSMVRPFVSVSWIVANH